MSERTVMFHRWERSCRVLPHPQDRRFTFGSIETGAWRINGHDSKKTLLRATTDRKMGRAMITVILKEEKVWLLICDCLWNSVLWSYFPLTFSRLGCLFNKREHKTEFTFYSFLFFGVNSNHYWQNVCPMNKVAWDFFSFVIPHEDFFLLISE